MISLFPLLISRKKGRIVCRYRGREYVSSLGRCDVLVSSVISQRTSAAAATQLRILKPYQQKQAAAPPPLTQSRVYTNVSARDSCTTGRIHWQLNYRTRYSSRHCTPFNCFVIPYSTKAQILHCGSSKVLINVKKTNELCLCCI